jgi:hypothetical protein
MDFSYTFSDPKMAQGESKHVANLYCFKINIVVETVVTNTGLGSLSSLMRHSTTDAATEGRHLYSAGDAADYPKNQDTFKDLATSRTESARPPTLCVSAPTNN